MATESQQVNEIQRPTDHAARFPPAVMRAIAFLLKREKTPEEARHELAVLCHIDVLNRAVALYTKLRTANAVTPPGENSRKPQGDKR